MVQLGILSNPLFFFSSGSQWFILTWGGDKNDSYNERLLFMQRENHHLMGLIFFFPLVLAKGLANRTARESGFRLGIGTGELRNFKRIAELRVHHDGGRLIGRIFPPRIDLELNLSCGTLSPMQ